MRIDNRLVGLAAVLLGAFVFVAGYGMPSLPHLRFGPGFFPCLVGLGLVLTGLGLIAQRLLERAAKSAWVTADADLTTAKAAVGLALMLGGIVFYILVADDLGFLLSAGLLLWLNLWWFWRRPLASLCLAVAAVIFIQYFFGSLMMVPLPWGVLEALQGVFAWTR